MSFAQSIIAMFVQPILSLILLVFFAYVIISWLFTLNIVSPNNPTARTIYSILASVVEPIVAPFRKIIPPLGNFDMGFFFAAMLLYWVSRYLIPGVVMPALA
ncbi:YggT family protein [Litorimonas sp. WD9-15]|uniref:YggT family protein n=1 Tax=Litorimonas sp. WD9-15 TaxID=3418716 RepID=UPI003D04C52C